MASQLFDGASYFSAKDAPSLKTAPAPAFAPYSAEEELPSLEEAPHFDWDGYARHLGAGWTREAALQSFLGSRLPQAVFRDSLVEIRPAVVWKFLGEPSRRALKTAVFRGFQQTPNLLRHEVVRTRLATHFREHPLEIPEFFGLWTRENPPILAHLDRLADARAAQWPPLAKTFGLPALVLGAIVVGDLALYSELVALIQSPAELRARLEAASPLESDSSPRQKKGSAPPGELETAPETQEQPLEAPPLPEQQLMAKLRAATARATRLQHELDTLKKEEVRRALARDKKQQNLQARLESERDELQKRLERLERRFKKSEAERETLDSTSRRLQKQLRAANVRMGEEQRRVATLEKRLASSGAPSGASSVGAPAEAQAALPAERPEAAVPSTPSASRNAVKISPLDEVFEWHANGRRVRFSAREVKRRLERNDEDAALDVALAIEGAFGGADERDQRAAGRFLERLRSAGAWCEHAISGSTTRVLVDASNVARTEKDARGRGKLANLLALRDELRRRKCWPVVMVADASLRHNIDDRTEFEAMIERGEVEQTDKGVEADEILARQARRTGAYVVTNDARFFQKVSPDFEPPRIAFRIYDGDVVVDEF